MAVRDSKPGVNLGMYLAEVGHMVSLECGRMMVKNYKFCEVSAVEHRRIQAKNRMLKRIREMV